MRIRLLEFRTPREHMPMRTVRLKVGRKPVDSRKLRDMRKRSALILWLVLVLTYASLSRVVQRTNQYSICIPSINSEQCAVSTPKVGSQPLDEPCNCASRRSQRRRLQAHIGLTAPMSSLRSAWSNRGAAGCCQLPDPALRSVAGAIVVLTEVSVPSRCSSSPHGDPSIHVRCWVAWATPRRLAGAFEDARG